MKPYNPHNDTAASERGAETDSAILSRRKFFERAAPTGAGLALLTGKPLDKQDKSSRRVGRMAAATTLDQRISRF